ncbi:MAG: hypothetical protein IIC51_07105 [Planctomycetes bacterium]|nr:hypothetical protein [Planctomycetota bacterium]
MWDLFPATDLWQTALAVLPLALIVAAICKWVPCRPATRHTLWLMLLVWMVAAPYLPPCEHAGCPKRAPNGDRHLRNRCQRLTLA